MQAAITQASIKYLLGSTRTLSTLFFLSSQSLLKMNLDKCFTLGAAEEKQIKTFHGYCMYSAAA